ncbi:hypothetical protein MMC27_003947 [Xylographa pallens]|nr:hypothetical protein [Xylographa pallens]
MRSLPPQPPSPTSDACRAAPYGLPPNPRFLSRIPATCDRERNGEVRKPNPEPPGQLARHSMRRSRAVPAAARPVCGCAGGGAAAERAALRDRHARRDRERAGVWWEIRWAREPDEGSLRRVGIEGKIAKRGEGCGSSGELGSEI